MSSSHKHREYLLYVWHCFWTSGRLFVADTNNSVIRFLDLNNKEPVLSTLELKGVQPPAPKSKSLRRLRRRSSADTETIVIDGGSSNDGKLCLKISVPEGYHLSKVLFVCVWHARACMRVMNISSTFVWCHGARDYFLLHFDV